MESTGVPTFACVPYTSGEGNVEKCPSSCADSGPAPGPDHRKKPTFYKATNIHYITNPKDVQMHLMQGGSVEAHLDVYDDFHSYKSGIYVHTHGAYSGGHAVKIIGWGNQNGTDYWVVANSWGTDWGMNGVFWIKFGQCSIDSECHSGDPQ